MAVKIHHPEPGRKHHFPLLIVQVIYVGPPNAKFTAALYKDEGAEAKTPIVPDFWASYGNLYCFGYRKLKGAYRLSAVETIPTKDKKVVTYAEDNVHFTVDPKFDTPQPIWPLAGDTITSALFMAYGNCQDYVTVAANQTMVPSPTVPIGTEQSTTANSATYMASMLTYWVSFGPVTNGNYLVTIVDDNNDPVQQNPVAVRA